MTPISELIKQPTIVKERKTEYGELQDYFISLGMKDRNGRLLSRGAIGFLLIPFVRGTKEDRNYSLLYALRTACQNSKNPQAVFWSHVKPKKR